MARIDVCIFCLLLAAFANGAEKTDVNCWRGDQCKSCDSGYTGSQNGVAVCCAECYKTGFTIKGGDYCTCFMPPPTGSSPSAHVHLSSAVLSGLVLLSALKVFTP